MFQIRETKVQQGEAGGITQQIGATFLPRSALAEKTAAVNKDASFAVEMPGMLMLDTPGHDSFGNLRNRGRSICDIAILVVDITPQTIESLQLLKKEEIPFVVALNKTDKIWKDEDEHSSDFRKFFGFRIEQIKLAFAEQSTNAAIFDENPEVDIANRDPDAVASLVPVSAVTGEGIPDLLKLLVNLTQRGMREELIFSSKVECTILEVKEIEGMGTTIDVILTNGVMKVGDRVVLNGMDGPIDTTVRALLTPQPMRELRIKSAYVHHKEVQAALGVKIFAQHLDKAIAGGPLYVAEDEDEVEYYKDKAKGELNPLNKFIAESGKGVWVQASTLGSLEAPLTFLQHEEIPVADFGLGRIHRKTIVRAANMADKAPQYAVILAFDVEIDAEVAELAQKSGLKVFSALSIYHLRNASKVYMAEVAEAKRQAAMPNAVWPCRLRILQAFTHRDPIILGVDLIEGTLKVGTPVGVLRRDKASGHREIIKLGKITSIEINHKSFAEVKRAQIGAGAAVKIERAPHEAAKLYGRHFDDKDEVVSLLSRMSIETLKSDTFRKEVEMRDWALIKRMKVEQGIQ
ncbi:P-loop containing nucleoside triphosphate hydrolase protein [Dioszegia hungarica]|uniref:P-loop containing nucleoside triphosphate hydrolase protein n=1 Tax=Dioszegia hungarica TaxID=4972 RepID=A0AA38HDZ2_9TREE|nr:P-loop containing nucleoside triphosphate hydrolase protein [Dioszegia hungarica]KAI9638510.1 P-loop containing nucleoside triphosphate hydrolase protein [Dioszegia hungarica]